MSDSTLDVGPQNSDTQSHTHSAAHSPHIVLRDSFTCANHERMNWSIRAVTYQAKALPPQSISLLPQVSHLYLPFVCQPMCYESLLLIFLTSLFFLFYYFNCIKHRFDFF